LQALLLLSGTTRAARDELEIESVFKPPHCADNAAAAGAFVEVRTVGRVADYAAGVGWVPRKGPKPFDQGTFWIALGTGQVVPGLEQGVAGMCAGEKRVVVIPPALGYGGKAKTGQGGTKIHAHSTLHFEVECTRVSRAKPRALRYPDNVFVQADRDESGSIALAELAAYFEETGVRADPREALAHDDADGDGSVSWEEFSGPKGTLGEVGGREEL
jgi:hypothetical protein